MPQVFHRSANSLSRLSIFGVVFFFAGLLWLIAQVNRSSFVTETDVVRAQPVPFSHEHHVGGLGIDCRYCHTSVEVSSFAGLPPTATCMNCHPNMVGSDVLKPCAIVFKTACRSAGRECIAGKLSTLDTSIRQRRRLRHLYGRVVVCR
jgi:hypothetical protein